MRCRECLVEVEMTQVKPSLASPRYSKDAVGICLVIRTYSPRFVDNTREFCNLGVKIFRCLQGWLSTGQQSFLRQPL